ncbi:alpha-N-acetylglucosaminidase [Tanacetum coccineum]
MHSSGTGEVYVCDDLLQRQTLHMQWECGAMSTTEAEYVAAAQACIESSLSALYLARNPAFHSKTKHLRVHIILRGRMWKKEPLDHNTDYIVKFPDWDPSLDTYSSFSRQNNKKSLITMHRNRRCVLSEVKSTLPQPHMWYSNSDSVKALNLLIAAGEDLARNLTYRYDLVDLTRQVLSKFANQVYLDALIAFQHKDAVALKSDSQKFAHLIMDIDQLLAADDNFLLGTWLESAKKLALTPQEKRQVEWSDIIETGTPNSSNGGVTLGLAAIKAVVAIRAIIVGGRLAIYDGIDILNLSVGPKSSCCVDISVSKSRKRTQRNVTSEAPPQKEFGEQLQELTIDERLQLRVKMGKAAVRHIRGMPSAYNDLGECDLQEF